MSLDNLRRVARENLGISGKQESCEFKEGLRVGIRRFAWWKDGVQYVGSCGTTLKAALAEIEDGKIKELLNETT